jgi:hypothetical protein
LIHCANALKAQTKGELCRVPIFIDAIKSGIPYLELSSDTVVIRESKDSFLRIFLKSCKGAMYLERFLSSNNSRVFTGAYVDAVKLDTVHGWAVDPMTGNRSPRTSTRYRPLRTGVWRYYNDKGQLLKEEEYINGELVKSRPVFSKEKVE